MTGVQTCALPISASSWSTLIPFEAVLSPGKSMTLFNHITAPCDAKGEYDLDIAVKGNDIIKTISQKVNVNQCSNS